MAPTTSGVSGYPITFTSYGSGAQPIINGSDLVTGWSAQSGSIYKASLGSQPHNVYVDGGPAWGLSNAASLSSMTAGSWFWSASTLYVWLSDSSNPSNHSVEAATRVAGFYINTGAGSSHSYLTVDGLSFMRTGGYGVYLHDYGTAGASGLAGIVIENNTVTQTGTGLVDGGQYYNAIHFLDETHSDDTGTKILNNTVSYCGGHNCIEAQDSDNIEIAGNDVSYYNHNGIDVKGGAGFLVHNNYVHDRPGLGAAFYIENTTSYKASVQWEENTVYNVSNGFQCAGGSGSSPVGCVAYNNSIYNAPTGIYIGPAGSDSMSIVLKNNIISGASQSLDNSDGLGSLTDDYNDWGANPTMVFGGKTYSLAQWLALGGHDHDLGANPMWVNAPANFGLQSVSPCMYAGTDVGLAYAPPAPDMGAVDSNGSATPTPTSSPTNTPSPTPTATPTPSPTNTPSPTPTPGSVAVITSPASGATVSGTVSVVVQAAGSVNWVNFYADNKYLASSPPYTYAWNSTTVTNGSHIISINAYNTSNALIGTSAINLNVQNGVPTPSPTPSSTPTGTPKPTPSPTPTPAAVSFSNVFVVVEENHSYAEVVGNTAEMPYLNALVDNYGVATNYYANGHPSLPNYLWLSSGSADGIGSDQCESTTGALNVDNVVRELVAAGVSWKAYEESLPSAGYMGCTAGSIDPAGSPLYAQKHNPLAYYSDVVNSTAQQQKIVPFTQFATDLKNGTLPRYGFITPNLMDDAHDGTLAQADGWLQTNLGPLLATPMFQPGGSGLLIVVFDEGTDNTHGGGQVAWVAISPKAKLGYQSTTLYQHQSTVRLMLEGLGVTTLPGAAATAPDMSEFFQ